jgi:hypothetical protein
MTSSLGEYNISTVRVDIPDYPFHEHSLVLCHATQTERSFEGVLCICLFGDEKKYGCISAILDTKNGR